MKTKGLKTFFLFAMFFYCLEMPLYSHRIVGEITPLMEQLNGILSLLESSKTEDAFTELKKDYDNRSPDEQVLLQNLIRLDNEFGVNLSIWFSESLEKKDSTGVKKALQTAVVLLMLEKFNLLVDSTNKIPLDLVVQREIYWSGRNYFSVLLEPTLSKFDPTEGVRMDRLLNRMQYSLEDKNWKRFQHTKIELLKRIEMYFFLSLPNSVLEKQ